MRVKFVQPIMLECDKLGYIRSVRVVQLVVDADIVELLGVYSRSESSVPNSSVVPPNILYSEFSKLRITKILEKHIKNISTSVVENRNMGLRDTLCSFVNYRNKLGIYGVKNIAVMRADGVVINDDVFAPIAMCKHVDSNAMCGTEIFFFDYKGNMYTSNQLCEKYNWANTEIRSLYTRTKTQHFTNDIYPVNTNLLVLPYDASKYSTLEDTEEDKRLSAAIALTGQADNRILAGKDSDYNVYTENIKRGKQICRIPGSCASIITSADNDVNQWQLVGHAGVKFVTVKGASLPVFRNFEDIYELTLLVNRSMVPMQLPLVTVAPCSTTLGIVQITIAKPYLEEFVDYVRTIYDCCELNIHFGTQQSKRVLLPDVHHLYYLTTLQTESFVLAIDKMQRKNGAQTALKSARECLIGLGIDVTRTQNVNLDLSKSQHTSARIMFDLLPHSVQGNPTVIVRLCKHMSFLYLYTSSHGLNENIYGETIDKLAYYCNTEGTNAGGEMHIYARVKHLCIYCNSSLQKKPIYIHGGVNRIDIVPIDGSEETLKQSKACIHIPKGTKTKIGNPIKAKGHGFVPIIFGVLEYTTDNGGVTKALDTEVTWYPRREDYGSFVIADL